MSMFRIPFGVICIEVQGIVCTPGKYLTKVLWMFPWGGGVFVWLPQCTNLHKAINISALCPSHTIPASCKVDVAQPLETSDPASELNSMKVLRTFFRRASWQMIKGSQTQAGHLGRGPIRISLRPSVALRLYFLPDDKQHKAFENSSARTSHHHQPLHARGPPPTSARSWDFPKAIAVWLLKA